MLYSVGGDGRDDGGVRSCWAQQGVGLGDWLVHLPGEPVPPQPEAKQEDRRPANWGILGHDPDF